MENRGYENINYPRYPTDIEIQYIRNFFKKQNYKSILADLIGIFITFSIIGLIVSFVVKNETLTIVIITFSGVFIFICILFLIEIIFTKKLFNKIGKDKGVIKISGYFKAAPNTINPYTFGEYLIGTSFSKLENLDHILYDDVNYAEVYIYHPVEFSKRDEHINKYLFQYILLSLNNYYYIDIISGEYKFVPKVK